jgi:hypothetical protein
MESLIQISQGKIAVKARKTISLRTLENSSDVESLTRGHETNHTLRSIKGNAWFIMALRMNDMGFLVTNQTPPRCYCQHHLEERPAPPLKLVITDMYSVASTGAASETMTYDKFRGLESTGGTKHCISSARAISRISKFSSLHRLRLNDLR